MADAIFGTDVILEKDIDGIFYEVLCGTDAVFNRVPEIIEVTNPTSGGFQDYMKRREGWSMSVTGLTKVENTATALTFFYMLQTSVRNTRHSVRITYTDSDGAFKRITGDVIIGPMSITSPVGDFADCSIELKGCGPFDSGDIIDPPPPGGSPEVIYSAWWDMAAGATFIDGASDDGQALTLEAKTILEVDREGTNFDIVTGTPGNRQCKHNNQTGVISFDATNPSAGEKVFVLFKEII